MCAFVYSTSRVFALNADSCSALKLDISPSTGRASLKVCTVILYNWVGFQYIFPGPKSSMTESIGSDKVGTTVSDAETVGRRS